MSQDPYRSSTGNLGRPPPPPPPPWDRERLERERGGRPGRPEVRDDHFVHGALPVRPRSPDSRAPFPLRGARPYPDGDSDIMERRSYRSDRDDFSDHSEYSREREQRFSPPPRHSSPSPPPESRTGRPGILRRQSSLDTFDRIPPQFLEREERYGPPARQDDYRPEPYIPIPLPRSKRLPPAVGEPIPLPRRGRESYDDLPPRREYYESPHPPRREMYNDPPPPRREMFDEPPPPRREYHDVPPRPARRPAFDESPYRGPDQYPEAPLSAPPTRRYFHEDIHIAEPGQDFQPVEEREIVRERRSRRHRRRGRSRSRSRSRSHSRDSRTTSTSQSHTVTSRSSSVSTSSSSSSADTTVKSNKYPKKGKTRIPARLVSKRALHDLGYPFEEDNGTVVVLLALGQKNIDDVLKLSDDYKKTEFEVEETKVVQALPAPPPPPPPPPTVFHAAPPETQTQAAIIEQPPAPARYHVQHAPPLQNPNRVEILPPGPPVEVMETRKVTREVSPVSYTTATSDYSYTATTSNPVDRLLESDHVHIGPLVLAKDHRYRRSSRHKSKSKSRSRSRSTRRGRNAIEDQIRELEAERDALRHERRHRRHRSSSVGSGEVVRYHERLDNGELIVYEEKVEEFSDSDDHSHHRRHRSKSRGARIERDKKGPPPKLVRAMLATLT